MSTALLAGCIWVLAATCTAFLPHRFQYVPGVVLLAAAPVVIALIAKSDGWFVAALAVAAVASMFRNPLRYYWGRLRGVDTPK